MLSNSIINKTIVALIISISFTPLLAKSLSDWKEGARKTINNNIKHCSNNEKNASNRATILNTKISRAKKLHAKSNINEFAEAIDTYTNSQNKFKEGIDYFRNCQISNQSALDDGLSLVKPTKNKLLQIDYFKSLADEASQLSNKGSTSYKEGSDYYKAAILQFNAGITLYNESMKNKNNQETEGQENSQKDRDDKELAINKHMDNSLDLKRDSQKMIDSIAKKLKAPSNSEGLADCLTKKTNFHKKAIEELNLSIDAFAEAIRDLNDPERSNTEDGIAFYNAALDYSQKASSVTGLCSK